MNVRRLALVATSFLLVSLTPLAFAATNIRLTSDPASSTNPRVALDPQSNAVVVWQDTRYGNSEILWQKFNQFGGPVSAVVRVTNTTATSANPDVSVDANGTSHIVWQEGVGGNGEGTVYLCRLDSSGNKTLADVLVRDFSASPRVAALASGASDIVYHRFNVSDQSVYYCRYNSAGSNICQKTLDLGTLPAIAKTPVVATDPNSGTVAVYWRDMDTFFNLELVQAQVSNTCGSPSACVAYGNSSAVNPSVDATGGVIWMNFERGGDIYNFQGCGNACKISQGSGTSTRPSIGADPSSGYSTWQDTRNGNSEIYFCKFYGCSNTTSDVRLTNDPASSLLPDIAVDKSGSGNWVVVWEDSRDGNWEIYMTSRVANDDHAPIVTPAFTTVSADPEQFITFQVTANDPDGDAISSLTSDYAQVLPTGASASFTVNNPSNTAGTFAWQVSCKDGGTYHVGFTAANRLSSTAYVDFSISVDKDCDGIPDSWEVQGIPLASGGTYMLPGATPNHKDFYLELDAMTGLAPSAAALQKIVAAFRDIPIYGNPDNSKGIALHIVGTGCDPCVDEADVSKQSWKALFPWSPPAFPSKFGQTYDAHFGTTSERSASNWSDVAAAKAKVFRYCVFVDDITWAGNTGVGEQPGNDLIVALGTRGGGTDDQQVGTLMHELGHTMGLDHGGGDNINNKPNYFSVMNYTWQMPLDVSTVPKPSRERYRLCWKPVYSDRELPALNELSLNEPAGIGGDPLIYVPVGPPAGGRDDAPMLVPMGGPVNWNRSTDQRATELGVQADADNLTGKNINPAETLHGFNDVAHLALLPRSSPLWQTGDHFGNYSSGDIDSIGEMTFTVYDSLNAMVYDCNNNGMSDDVEVASGTSPDVNGDGVPDECQVTDVTGVAVSNQAISLFRITPLPVTSTSATVIEFTTGTRRRVSVRVYDLSGRLVVSLLEATVAPGLHQIAGVGSLLRAARIASGVYFVRVTGGEQALKGRLVYLK